MKLASGYVKSTFYYYLQMSQTADSKEMRKARCESVVIGDSLVSRLADHLKVSVAHYSILRLISVSLMKIQFYASPSLGW